MAPPFKQAEFQILYGQGINRLGEVVDYGVKLGMIDKAGAWYSCQGEKIGQGKQNAIQYLREHPELAQSLEERIKAEMLGSGAGLTTATAEDFAEEEM